MDKYVEERINALVVHYTKAYYILDSPPNPNAFMRELQELVNYLRWPE